MVMLSFDSYGQQSPGATPYPMQPRPDLAPARLASPENGAQNQLYACEGSYYDAIWTECFGEVTFDDGRRYRGGFSDGQFNGQGTETFRDGKKYVGEFKYGQRDGQGTETLPDGEKYVGEFKDGKRNGQGTATYSDGREYTGEWRNGKYNGHGTATYPDGRKYVGEFRDLSRWPRIRG